MTSDPPETEKSAQATNPLLAERRRAERAEAELLRVQVQIASMRPPDRPPLSRRVVQAVQATPPLLQVAAVISAVAGLLHALAALMPP